jgi:hypothetical protein
MDDASFVAAQASPVRLFRCPIGSYMSSSSHTCPVPTIDGGACISASQGGVLPERCWIYKGGGAPRSFQGSRDDSQEMEMR